LKVYLEVIERSGDVATDRARAVERLSVLRAGLEEFLAAV
jgi:hypothetical protein